MEDKTRFNVGYVIFAVFAMLLGFTGLLSFGHAMFLGTAG